MIMTTENPMVSEEQPIKADFPNPYKERGKEKGQSELSIDAILRRTHPSQRRVNSLADTGIQAQFKALETSEKALAERERGLLQLRTEVIERERIVRETEILLNARERLLDDRESVLRARHVHGSDDENLLAFEKSLKDTREALAEANDALFEKETFISELRAELDELKERVANASTAGEPAQVSSYEAINHPSLAEQVAFLQEREAFIEQSENTLFDKAQSLQEWETRLQQNEHDQANA